MICGWHDTGHAVFQCWRPKGHWHFHLLVARGVESWFVFLVLDDNLPAHEVDRNTLQEIYREGIENYQEFAHG